MMSWYTRYLTFLTIFLANFGVSNTMEFDLKSAFQLIGSLFLGPKKLNLNIKENHCPLCEKEFNLTDPDFVTLNCNISHTFHKSCASIWVKEHGTCPIDGQIIKPACLLGEFTRKQEIIRDVLTFCSGSLDGAQGYLFFKQSFCEPLSLFMIRSLLSTAVDHYDSQFFPEKITERGEKIVDPRKQLRQYALTSAASGIAAALIGKQDLFFLQLIRPPIRYYGVGILGKKVINLACPFDYELACKLDQRIIEPKALQAGGAVAGIFLGMALESKLQDMLERVTGR